MDVSTLLELDAVEAAAGSAADEAADPDATLPRLEPPALALRVGLAGTLPAAPAVAGSAAFTFSRLRFLAAGAASLRGLGSVPRDDMGTDGGGVLDAAAASASSERPSAEYALAVLRMSEPEEEAAGAFTAAVTAAGPVFTTSCTCAPLLLGTDLAAATGADQPASGAGAADASGRDCACSCSLRSCTRPRCSTAGAAAAMTATGASATGAADGAAAAAAPPAGPAALWPGNS